MKAAVLAAAGKFVVTTLPDPICPPDGLVLGVRACGVCGSDLRRWKEGPVAGAVDHIEGHEVGGLVLETGPRCTHFKIGDRLSLAPDVHCGRCWYCRRGMFNLCDSLRLVGITPGLPGGFAEKMALDGNILENGIVHAMPAGMTYPEAALAEPCCSVLACHHKAGATIGDTVVVLGSGPIGCLHVVVSQARGARVIVSEPSEPRRRMAERFRPNATIDPFKEDAVARVRDLTGGRGADVVVCANPVATTQTQAVEMVRKGGRVVLFGGLPRANHMTSLDANRIHYGEIAVVGAFSYHPTVHEMALDAIIRKLIPADKLITHTYRLDEVGQAFETAAGGDGLKVMVTME